MQKVLVILGPTATGKTDLALQLALKVKGELVAADSRQVYRGLDVGTGKLPTDSTYEVRRMVPRRFNWKIGGINIWMYDVVSLDKQYTVASYVKDANKVIIDILKRHKLPIVIGGTGLYLKALLSGLDNLSIPVDENLREELGKLSLEQLQDKLQSLSPDRWGQLSASDRANSRRLLRSIELVSMYPYKRSQKTVGLEKQFDILKIGLTAPRKALYKKSDLRVLSWFDEDILKEVKGLVKNGVPLKRFGEFGLGYASLADYLDKKISEDNLVTVIQNRMHSYIRRQLTWFKKDHGIYWFDITTENFTAQVEKLVSSWYDYG